MSLRDIKTIDVKGKRVFVRLDLDVPVQNGVIGDDTRLKASLPTLEYLLENGASVVIGGHLGRPNPQESGIKNIEYSLEPIVKWYVQNYQLSTTNYHVGKIGELEGWKLSDTISILENLRFYPGEKANDPNFSQQLAALADVYINDAFAVSHRNHCSIVKIATLLPHAAGFQLQKEVNTLLQIIENPKRPLVVIVGGVKIETKLPLIEKMHQVADCVLVGGKIAQQVSESYKGRANVVVGKTTADTLDIEKESIDEFLSIIATAKTIVWNGPMGQIKDSGLKIQENSTTKIANGIIQSKAYSVVGGGDTVEVLKNAGMVDKFSFVSTGGGAMLSLLSGEKLPGLEALQ